MTVSAGGARVRRRWSVLTVGVLLAASGCASSVPPSGPVARPVGEAAAATAEPAAETVEPVEDHHVVALGRNLDAALQSGDVEQWMAHFDLPDDDARQQRDWFAGVHAVPMDVREIHATRVQARSSAAVRGPRVDLAFRHQVTGADPEPAVESYRVHVEWRGEALKVVELSHVSNADTGYPQLWDLGPIEVVELGALVVLTTPDLVEEVDGYLPLLDDAAAGALEDFHLPQVERMVVTVADEAAFAEVTAAAGEGTVGWAQPMHTVASVSRDRGLADLRWGEGYALRLHLQAEFAAQEWTYYGHRLAAGLPLLRYQAAYLALLLQHPDTLPPAWATEGFTGWYQVAGDDEVREEQLWWTAELLTGDLPQALPPRFPGEFYGGAEEEVSRRMAEATAVFLYVEEAFGWDAAMRLGVALNELERPSADVATVLADELEVGVEEFEQGFLDWLADTVSEQADGGWGAR